MLSVVHFCCWEPLSSKSGLSFWHLEKFTKWEKKIVFGFWYNLVGTFIGIYWTIPEKTVRLTQKPLLWEHFQNISHFSTKSQTNLAMGVTFRVIRKTSDLVWVNTKYLMWGRFCILDSIVKQKRFSTKVLEFLLFLISVYKPHKSHSENTY